ncbi:MAG: T9SS type A sorting domain-containing protein [Candidatus Marinimicrobia bacterium]|nr:T9SS type A sorting domain-containing protein [Candidatus Neomarinimicrobiota bacterium]
MKFKSIIGSFSVVMVLLLSSKANAHVALNFPVGGEVFVVGDTLTIEWTLVVPHPQNNWDLFFSPDGGITWEEIKLDIDIPERSYQWVVPQLTIDEGRIRIYMDNVGEGYTGTSENFSIRGVVTVEDEEAFSRSFNLYPNYPNPFNPSTTISFTLSNASRVSLLIYDIHGREVESLIEGIQPAGSHSIEWNASNLASGVYFYRLTADEFIQTRKMILIK